MENEENFIYVYICPLCEKKYYSEDTFKSHTKVHLKDASTTTSEQEINNNLNKSNTPCENSDSNKENSPKSYIDSPSYNYFEIKYNPIYELVNFSLVCDENGQLRIIGNGTYGQVFLAQNNIDNKLYAIKHMEKKVIMNHLNDLSQIYSEINIQSRINHPNIIKLLYVKETETAFDLVMEYAPCGSLFEYVIKCKGLPEKVCYKYFIQIVNAIKFLHENNIIHRDLKPENILIFNANLVKLCDFGWAIQTEDELPGGSFIGTIEYMAPEIINFKNYGKEMDLWTLGILLYELIHAFSPFRPKKSKFDKSELIDNIKEHKIEFYLPLSDECKNLIISLLEVDPKKRCTIDEILNSDFVKMHENESVKVTKTESVKCISRNDISKTKDENTYKAEKKNCYDGINQDALNKKIISNSYKNIVKRNDKISSHNSEKNIVKVKNKNKVVGVILNRLKNGQKNYDTRNNKTKYKPKISISTGKNSNNSGFNFSEEKINKTQPEKHNYYLKRKLKNGAKDSIKNLIKKRHEIARKNNQNNKKAPTDSQRSIIINKTFSDKKLQVDNRIENNYNLNSNNQLLNSCKLPKDSISKLYFPNKITKNRCRKYNIIKGNLGGNQVSMGNLKSFKKKNIFSKFPVDNTAQKAKKEPIDNKIREKKVLFIESPDDSLQKTKINGPKMYYSCNTFCKRYIFDNSRKKNNTLFQKFFGLQQISNKENIINDKTYDNFKEKEDKKDELAFIQEKKIIDIPNKKENHFSNNILINNKVKKNYVDSHKINKIFSNPEIEPEASENLHKNKINKVLNILYSNSKFSQKPQISIETNLNENIINKAIKHYTTDTNLVVKNNEKNNDEYIGKIEFNNLANFKTKKNIKKNDLIENKTQNDYQKKENQVDDKINIYNGKTIETELDKNDSDSIIDGDSEYGCFIEEY